MRTEYVIVAVIMLLIVIAAMALLVKDIVPSVKSVFQNILQALK